MKLFTSARAPPLAVRYQMTVLFLLAAFFFPTGSNSAVTCLTAVLCRVRFTKKREEDAIFY
jgi:hypothetical protein